MFKMVDVSGGKMTLKHIEEEIAFYMYHKEPKRLIVDIRRKPDGCYAKLWMSKEDFEKAWKPSLPK